MAKWKEVTVKDNERFYATHTFYSFADFSTQLKRYNRRDYNNFPMRPLGLEDSESGTAGFFHGQCNKCLTNLHMLSIFSIA